MNLNSNITEALPVTLPSMLNCLALGAGTLVFLLHRVRRGSTLAQQAAAEVAATTLLREQSAKVAADEEATAKAKVQQAAEMELLTLKEALWRKVPLPKL